MAHPVFAEGNVALITGAASGIGRAAAGRFASLGMKVCLVDIDEDELAAAREEVAQEGSEALSIVTDIADFSRMESLRDEVIEQFGAVHLLMNNAVTRVGGGIGGDLDEWRKAMNVNFWGVDHAIRVFLPGMIANGPGLIVHSGSKQGITNPPGNTVYNVTKSALKTYTEALAHDLRNTDGCEVTAHLLVPGMTTTGKREHREGAWWPEQVIDHMMPALERGDFYIICPDGEVTFEMDTKRMAWATGDIVSNRPALSRWHPDYKKAFEEFSP